MLHGGAATDDSSLVPGLFQHRPVYPAGECRIINDEQSCHAKPSPWGRAIPELTHAGLQSRVKLFALRPEG